MLLLAVFALPICISDWRYHRIPNIYLLFMFYPIAFLHFLSGSQSITVIIVTIFCVCVLTLVGMGVGDAKLFVIIALTLNLASFGDLLLLAAATHVATIVQLVFTWRISRRLPRNLPLALSIFLGSALYLGASTSTSLRQYADALVNSW